MTISSDIFIPIVSDTAITGILADCDGGGLYPPFNIDIHDYYIRESSVSGVANISLFVNEVDRTPEVIPSGSINKTLYITDDTQEYFIKIIPIEYYLLILW